MTAPGLTRARRADLVRAARERCFFLDLDDAAARLCRANMPFGLAKIHWMQSELGLEPDACYVSTPDSTVTRNLDRWSSGFGYGGAVMWSGDLVPLELKPNFCGMLVAGLDHRPDVPTLMRTIARIAETTIDVQGVQAHWDMHHGNHFVNLYGVSDPAATGGMPYVAVMHSSGSELRGPNPLGPGLYLSNSPAGTGLALLARSMPTPFGTAHYLTGGEAAEFLGYCDRVSDFAHARREAYARAIFGDDVRILFNEMHQGLDGPGRMLLGCYRVTRRNVPWVVVTLRPDLPAYLVAPERIYSERALEREGMLERARATGCLERVLGADLLPHGGGYAYPGSDGLDAEVDDPGPAGRRRFRMGDGPWFEDARELEFSYRGERVIRRIEDLGAGRVVASLDLVARLEG